MLSGAWHAVSTQSASLLAKVAYRVLRTPEGGYLSVCIGNTKAHGQQAHVYISY